jgi:hypothetical protein
LLSFGLDLEVNSGENNEKGKKMLCLGYLVGRAKGRGIKEESSYVLKGTMHH